MRDVRHDIAIIAVLSISKPKCLLVGRGIANEAVLAAGNGKGRLCATRSRPYRFRDR